MATTYARDLTGNGMGECLGELFMLSESAHWSCEVELPAEPGDYVPKAIKPRREKLNLKGPGGRLVGLGCRAEAGVAPAAAWRRFPELADSSDVPIPGRN